MEPKENTKFDQLSAAPQAKEWSPNFLFFLYEEEIMRLKILVSITSRIWFYSHKAFWVINWIEQNVGSVMGLNLWCYLSYWLCGKVPLISWRFHEWSIIVTPLCMMPEVVSPLLSLIFSYLNVARFLFFFLSLFILKSSCLRWVLTLPCSEASAVSVLLNRQILPLQLCHGC